MKNPMKRIHARVRSLRTRRYIAKNEQTFLYQGNQMKYLYIPSKGSRNLVVVFSAFPGARGIAGYNFVATLRRIKVNKLFLLDEFGYKKRGAYYLSENGDFDISSLVRELLHAFMKEKQIVWFCGSSKGGTAALYFGLSTQGVKKIICGAPQYYIGRYLTEKESHIPILDAMAGNHDQHTVDQYDHLLPDLVRSSNGIACPEILIHYSPREPTYRSHIHDLVFELKHHGFRVAEDIEQYDHHDEVAKFFPTLLYKQIKKMEENNE